ncbi:lachesin-like [Alosa sapidissima]|uniref:lachesin-like n=1 Tax=Alosa sapidissima TaxID=34773 RepID=UPI001C0A19FA|nr:lachesin-like [Alosa sapidissima]
MDMNNTHQQLNTVPLKLMMTCLPSLIVILLMMKGVDCNWRVTYTPNIICALEGSSLNLSCSYTYPSHLKIQDAFWMNEDCDSPTDFSKDPNYSQRVWADCQTKSSTCHLHLKNLTKVDAHHLYYCRITTHDDEKQRWTGKPGVNLSVTDLKVTGPENLTEGAHVTLSCTTTCSLSGDPSFVWEKNGRAVEGIPQGGRELHLSPVRAEDQGSYSCAVGGHEDLPSPPLSVSVMYSPKNTSASTNRSSSIIKGSSVTLTCSSVANPPVESYTWFKVNESTPVGSGQQYSITNISSEDEGQYYCKAKNRLGIGASAAMTIGIEEDMNIMMYAVIGVSTICGFAGLFCVVFWMRIHCTAEEINEEDLNDTTTNKSDKQGDGIYLNYQCDDNMGMDSVYQNSESNTAEDNVDQNRAIESVYENTEFKTNKDAVDQNRGMDRVYEN